MPHKVPQNIDIEDKVIGFLTLKQFIYAAMGAGIMLILYYIFKGLGMPILFYIIGLPIGFFFLALAFVRIANRPLEILIISTIANLSRPKKRVWKKEPYKKREVTQVQKNNDIYKKKHYTSMDLNRLAFIVDSGGSEELLRNRGILAGIQKNDKLPEKNDLNDTISPSEIKNKKVTDMLKEAREKMPKKELKIQQLATINPNKEFVYSKLQKIEGSLTEEEEILRNAKKTQEERFKAARISH